MLAALRSRLLPTRPWNHHRHKNLGFPLPSFTSTTSTTTTTTTSSSSMDERVQFLNLEEVEKVLSDVKADDVRVIPVKDHCDWTDYMVVATGRSTWHVRNIAQALIHKVKQKQKGADRLLLPSVEGHGAGNWIVIDSGTVIVHALEENARAYYNLEGLWTTNASPKGSNQDLEKAIVKTRRKNNSKKPTKTAA